MSDSTAQRQKTCAERIEEHKRGRLEDFAALNDAYANAADDTTDDASSAIYEYPLDVSTFRTWRIDLSTGGPGDWIEIQTDSEGDPTRVEYHFNDWFDHASVTLDGLEREQALEFARMVTADFYIESA